MADVFISYHEKSSGELAQKIAGALEDAGISCWYARRDLAPVAEFARTTPDEIEKCKVFLILLTAGAVKSRLVQSELSFASFCAERGSIQILPVRFESVALNSGMRYYLARLQIMNAPPVTELVRRVAQMLDTANGLRAFSSERQSVRLSP